MNADSGPFPGQAHPSPARAQASLASSWFALLAAPHAWALQLLIGSAITGYACYPHDAPLAAPIWDGMRAVLYLVEAACVALCVAGGWVAWRNWRRTRHEKPGSGRRLVEGGDGRTRFMAMSGLMISALFLVAIVFSSVQLIVLGACG